MTRQGHIHDTLPRYSCLSTLQNTCLSRETPKAPQFHPKTTHSYSSTSTSLKLTLQSSAKSSKSRPVYFEGDRVEGTVHITAEKGDSIQILSVTLLGRINIGRNDSIPFFESRRTLWCADERLDKLRGHHDFEFSLELPSKILLQDQATSRLPHTFIERDLRISIEYELVVTLEKGRLRSDVALKTPFVYVPLSAPPPLPHIRQLAYRSHSVTALPGPNDEPNGWHSLAPILGLVASDVASSPKGVRFLCQISLAAPLSYTRGSILPLFITFSPDSTTKSDDAFSILGAISSPSVLSNTIVLRRRIRHVKKRGTTKDWVTDIQSPVFWRTDTRGAHTDKWTLQGEVALPADMMPSVQLDSLSVSYELVVNELVCTDNGRPAKGAASSPWVSQAVEIVSAFASGPRPISYAPRRESGPTRRHQAIAIDILPRLDVTYGPGSIGSAQVGNVSGIGHVTPYRKRN